MNQEEAINAEIYCQQLERVRRKLRNCHILVIFLQGNAKPRIARLT